MSRKGTSRAQIEAFTLGWERHVFFKNQKTGENKEFKKILRGGKANL